MRRCSSRVISRVIFTRSRVTRCAERTRGLIRIASVLNPHPSAKAHSATPVMRGVPLASSTAPTRISRPTMNSSHTAGISNRFQMRAARRPTAERFFTTLSAYTPADAADSAGFTMYGGSKSIRGFAPGSSATKFGTRTPPARSRVRERTLSFERAIAPGPEPAELVERARAAGVRAHQVHRPVEAAERLENRRVVTRERSGDPRPGDGAADSIINNAGNGKGRWTQRWNCRHFALRPQSG